MNKGLEEVKEKIRNMETGYENMFTHTEKLPPNSVDRILDELGCGSQIGEDWNGCDLDWSVDFEFEGMKMHAWGSGYSGSMNFQKN